MCMLNVKTGHKNVVMRQQFNKIIEAELSYTNLVSRQLGLGLPKPSCLKSEAELSKAELYTRTHAAAREITIHKFPYVDKPSVSWTTYPYRISGYLDG